MISELKKIFSFLDFRSRIVFFTIIIITFLVGVAEFLGIATALPILQSIFDNSIIKLGIFGFDVNFLILDNKNYYLVFLILFFFFRNLLAIINGYLLQLFLHKNYLFISSELLNNRINVNYEKFIKIHSSIFIRNIRELSIAYRIYLLSYINIFSEIILIFFLSILLLLVDLKLTLYGFLVILIFSLFFINFLKKKSFFWGKGRTNTSAEINKILNDIYNSFREIKIYNNFNFFFNNFKSKNIKFSNSQKKFDFFSSIIRNIFEIFLLLLISFSFILFVDVQKELNSNLPKLIIFFLVIFRTYPSFGRISSLRLSLKNNQYAVNEIYNIINKNKNKNINSSKKFQFQKKIEIKNLFFKYENKKDFALKNINFIVKKNQIIGITGKNGSGKTTLCNILLTLLSPVSGKIIVDNKFDIFKNVGSYRRLISFIPQNIYLINDTIERNITLCLETENIDYKKLRYYLNVLNITHLIKKNNNILKNINIGENGNYLSGGEKQRIAIARALYQDAEIIIMDEHTSSLDLKSEREIMKDLVKLKSTKTFFIISHRKEVFKFCDRVLTLEDGKVVNTKLNNL